MPLAGFESLCNERAAQIVSRDRKNPQYHKGINAEKSYVTHYQIDGVVIKNGNRCDFLLMNEDKLTAYLIELKGSDLVKAAEQLEATETALKKELKNYSLRYRIIANKSKTHEITSSAYRKYQMKWKRDLVQASGQYEEKI